MASVLPSLQQHPTPGQAPCTPVPPNLSLPLINEPQQTCPTAQLDTLDLLQLLVGTWTNQNYANGQGGPDNPYSYNLMVLPQKDPSSPEGYILKNMQYYEEITFSPIHGNAANRGGTGVQVCNPLFYEQRIYISEASGTPATNTLVHAENGAWLVLTSSDQFAGPYSTGEKVPDSKPPTGFPTLVKQISVPHGNSVLAIGEMPTQHVSGAPTISPPPQVLPTGVDTTPYSTDSVGNPNVHFTANPNLLLNNALAAAPVGQYIMFQVDSKGPNGQVTNIGFEQDNADVMQYSATYWLEALEGSSEFNQLQYTQTIMLSIPISINGQTVQVLFPHITCNTLTRVTSWDESAADKELNAELQA